MVKITLKNRFMKAVRRFATIAFLSLLCVPISSGQENKAANPAATPPNLVVLVHQEVQYGKESARQRLAVETARACDRLNVPNFWIDLQSFTGPREAIFFDPFDSFEHLDAASADWGRIYATHPDLARMQEQIDGLLSSERTIVAFRRDDLGYAVNTIDLSETRFLRVLEVRLFPGRESDFAEASRILADAYQRIKAGTPWVVYQVESGIPTPAFLVLMPMHELKQNDDLLSWNASLLEAEGPDAAQRLQQIVQAAYATTETSLYAVKPEMSHVSKEFAEGDPEFWTGRPAPEPKPAKSESLQKPSSREKP